jgi:hypothetical protein
MTGGSTDNNGGPILNIEGDLVALGPIRRVLLPLYQRWVNDLGTVRALDLPPRPLTREMEQDWYDYVSKAEDVVPLTIYERDSLREGGLEVEQEDLRLRHQQGRL